MNARTTLATLLVTAAISPAGILAQTGAATSSGETIGQACTDEAYRQFDYWLGRWTVTGPQGTQVGTNHIIRVSDGCAVLEQWRDARGVRGTSISFYDAAKRQWEQHWMGGQGGALHLVGGLHEGNIRLEGKRTGPNGPIMDRVTWIRMEGGKVRQFWETSGDEGKTWTTSFDGVYSPVSAR
jgi:hypothetical protein